MNNRVIAICLGNLVLLQEGAAGIYALPEMPVESIGDCLGLSFSGGVELREEVVVDGCDVFVCRPMPTAVYKPSSAKLSGKGYRFYNFAPSKRWRGVSRGYVLDSFAQQVAEKLAARMRAAYPIWKTDCLFRQIQR